MDGGRVRVAGAHRRGDQPAAVPPAGAHARPRTSPSTTSTRTSREDPTMLRIAVPNKGSLSEPAVDMLREAGYRTRRDPKELVVADPDNDVEFFYLRPRDIAVYVGSGTVDAASPAATCCSTPAPRAVEVMALGLRRVDLPVCRPAGRRATASPTSAGTGWRRATRAWSRSTSPTTASRPRSCGSTAPSRRRSPSASPTSSPTSSRPGRRCARQGLEVFGEPILRSEAVLVRREGSEEHGRPSRCCAVACSGVITARHYVHARLRRPGRPSSTQACAITPGLESPTVSPCRTATGAPCGRWCRASSTNRGHGRALRPRRPGHPRHRHHRLPALSDPAGAAPGAAPGRPVPAAPRAGDAARHGRPSPSRSASVVAVGLGASGEWRSRRPARPRRPRRRHRGLPLALREHPGRPRRRRASPCATSS